MVSVKEGAKVAMSCAQQEHICAVVVALLRVNVWIVRVPAASMQLDVAQQIRERVSIARNALMAKLPPIVGEYLQARHARLTIQKPSKFQAEKLFPAMQPYGELN